MHTRAISNLGDYLQQLLSAPQWRFDKSLHENLPEKQGIYVISRIEQPGIAIRAGRTPSAKGGLRQRVYGNHFMGNQSGNLRKQLIRDEVCQTLKEAKEYIRQNMQVQVLVITDDEQRKRAEYFMLAVLNPKYSS